MSNKTFNKIKAPIMALLTMLVLCIVSALHVGYNQGFENGKNFGTRIKGKRHYVMLPGDEAQIAPLAIIAGVMAFFIGIGIIIIVAVLMPAIAGNVITAINVTASNPFYTQVQAVPGQAQQPMNLLWVAVLVGVVALIIGTIAGLLFIFGRH